MGTVNTTHWTFVCTGCSGILRKLNFKVKSIYAAHFTEDEVDNLRNGGNVACDKVYLAKFKSGKGGYTKPEEGDTRRIEEFMKLKYVEKRWYSTKSKKRKKKNKEPTPPPPSSSSSESES